MSDSKKVATNTPKASLGTQKLEARSSARSQVLTIPITTVGLIAALFALWDIWLQTVPYVQPPPLSDKIDVLPFTVTNPSHFFTMYNAQIQYDLKDPDPTLVNGKYFTIDARMMTSKSDIAPLGFDTISLSPVYSPQADMTKEERLRRYAQISTMLISIAVCYETRLFFQIFRRETEPTWFMMETSIGGERYWTPVNPGYTDNLLGNNKHSVSADCESGA
jgi:hypothetical protein